MLKRTTHGMPTPSCNPWKPQGSECRVGGRRARVEGLKRELGWIAHLVQILVVVANIQLRTLKAEVEKVSM